LRKIAGTGGRSRRLRADLGLPLDAARNFGENDGYPRPWTSVAAVNLGAGPLWREFYGALVMSVPPAIEPADSKHMKILTMPDPHAIPGMRRFLPRAIAASNMEALS
jgi:hypothetical protein